MWARVHSGGTNEDEGARMRTQTRVYGVDKIGMRTRARVRSVDKNGGQRYGQGCTTWSRMRTWARMRGVDKDEDKDAERGQG